MMTKYLKLLHLKYILISPTQNIRQSRCFLAESLQIQKKLEQNGISPDKAVLISSIVNDICKDISSSFISKSEYETIQMKSDIKNDEMKTKQESDLQIVKSSFEYVNKEVEILKTDVKELKIDGRSLQKESSSISQELQKYHFEMETEFKNVRLESEKEFKNVHLEIEKVSSDIRLEVEKGYNTILREFQNLRLEMEKGFKNVDLKIEKESKNVHLEIGKSEQQNLKYTIGSIVSVGAFFMAALRFINNSK